MRRLHLAAGLLLLLARHSVAADEPLPPGAVQRLGQAAFRTGGYIRDLACSPDGKRLADVCPSAIHLLDAASGHVLRSWPHHHPSNAVFSPDGKSLIAAAGGEGIVLHDLAADAE